MAKKVSITFVWNLRAACVCRLAPPQVPDLVSTLLLVRLPLSYFRVADGRCHNEGFKSLCVTSDALALWSSKPLISITLAYCNNCRTSCFRHFLTGQESELTPAQSFLQLSLFLDDLHEVPRDSTIHRGPWLLCQYRHPATAIGRPRSWATLLTDFCHMTSVI